MLCLETCRGKYNEDDYLREIKGGYIGIKESVSFSKVCFFYYVMAKALSKIQNRPFLT